MVWGVARQIYPPLPPSSVSNRVFILTLVEGLSASASRGIARQRCPTLEEGVDGRKLHWSWGYGVIHQHSFLFLFSFLSLDFYRMDHGLVGEILVFNPPPPPIIYGGRVAEVTSELSRVLHLRYVFPTHHFS